MVAGAGEVGADFAAQQAILPPQPQPVLTAVAHELAIAGNICPSKSDNPQRMASVAFTVSISMSLVNDQKTILAKANHFLSAAGSDTFWALSALRIFLMYFSGFLSKSFLQPLQHSFTS